MFGGKSQRGAMRRRQRALHGRLSAEARKGVYACRTQESALNPSVVALSPTASLLLPTAAALGALGVRFVISVPGLSR